MFCMISLTFGRGPRSPRAIDSLRFSAFPISPRLTPHLRQNCWRSSDSAPQLGQNILTSDFDPLRLVPESVHLVERRLLDRAAVLVESRLDMGETTPELSIRGLERRLGIHADE